MAENPLERFLLDIPRRRRVLGVRAFWGRWRNRMAGKTRRALALLAQSNGRTTLYKYSLRGTCCAGTNQVCNQHHSSVLPSSLRQANPPCWALPHPSPLLVKCLYLSTTFV